MNSSTEKSVQKVQEHNRGALTPSLMTQEEDFPPLSIVDPFARRSTLSRSPVRGRMAEKAASGTPETVRDSSPVTETRTPREALVTSPYEAVIRLARQEEEEYLVRCFEVIESMKSATQRQKNISQDVKNGLVLLEASLKHIEHLRKSWQSCERTLVSSSTQTTPPPRPKRAASSPAEPGSDKRKRVDDPSDKSSSETWVEVVKRKKRQKNASQTAKKKQEEEPKEKPRKKRSSKQRPDALLVKPSEGKSYADVLSEIREKVKPEEKGAVIKTLRKTRAGDLLIELGQSSESKSDFGADLQSVLGTKASVRLLVPKTTLEVRDLDELATEEEVTVAVKSVLGASVESKVFVSKANARGQKMAIITVGAKEAAKLLSEGHLKVGWVSCRVREKLAVTRCFKCLGFGHVAIRCSGPDRSKFCFKCGGQDHRASACKATESCVLCAQAGLKGDSIKHASGSSRCQAYKQALQELRSSHSK